MRQVITGVSILCVFAMLFQGCKGDKHVAKAPSLAEMVAQLCDEEYTVRSDARYVLREERNSLTRVLRDRLSRLSNTRDTDYEGPLHLTVEALGTWRIEGAVPVLVEMVDYQLDRATMPVGKKLPAYAYYPVAAALRTIGGMYVQRVIVKRLCAEDDAKVVRICVWVLFEAYGEDVARLMLEVAEARTQDSGVRERLAAAKKLVAEGPRLLTHPEARK